MKIHVFICLILVLLCSCHPPVVDDTCTYPSVRADMQHPVIAKVSINGLNRDPGNLWLEPQEDNLLVELEPAEVDSYVFKLNIPGLPRCGMKTPFPQAHFTFLPGGDYRLEYWMEKNGKMSASGTLVVHIKQALTERWWFYPSLGAYLALIVSAIIYFWRLYNIRQKLNLQHVRNQIASDLHDEVSSDLSGMSIAMTTLKRRVQGQLPALVASVQDIQETLEHTKRNLADTVWAINPEKDSGQELWGRMDKFAHKLLNTDQTELRFNNTLPAGKSFKISMEQRFNALMIFKEAVHNIHKHAAATAVDISIQPHPDGVCVDIRDNGSGFDPTAERDGNGVSNYFRRAADSFIDFSLDTAPGKGTAIRMIIPEL